MMQYGLYSVIWLLGYEAVWSVQCTLTAGLPMRQYGVYSVIWLLAYDAVWNVHCTLNAGLWCSMECTVYFDCWVTYEAFTMLQCTVAAVTLVVASICWSLPRPGPITSTCSLCIQLPISWLAEGPSLQGRREFIEKLLTGDKSCNNKYTL